MRSSGVCRGEKWNKESEGTTRVEKRRKQLNFEQINVQGSGLHMTKVRK
jgi:hypothetical protein